jgi:hypothetical protein
MKHWYSDNYTTICSWTAVIVGALIVLWGSLGTRYHQVAIGLLASSIVLPAALPLSDIVCNVVSVVINSAGGDPKR